MSDWLVSPSEETDWRLDLDDFAQRLRERWPEAEVTPIDHPDLQAAFDFTVETESGRLDGSVPRDGQAVWFDGDVPPAAELAAFVREVVPDQQELLFYDQGYSLHVALAPGTSAADVRSAVEAQLG